MKRIMRFFARLYPSSWRSRYGTEFDALLEDATPSGRDAFDVLRAALKMQVTTWTFRRIVLAGVGAGILMAAAVSVALPAHYLSQSSFTLMPTDGSSPANESTRQLVSSMERNVFSREFLTAVIHEHNLYWRERLRMPLDDVVEKMRSAISVHSLPVTASGKRDTITLVVQFDYSDPRVAQRVNEELTSRFIEGGLNSQLASNWTFSVPEAPSLPLRPAAPNRARLSTVGLVAGLFAGLTLAILLRSRHGKTAS
jgi:hypothetical protein